MLQGIVGRKCKGKYGDQQEITLGSVVAAIIEEAQAQAEIAECGREYPRHSNSGTPILSDVNYGKSLIIPHFHVH